MAGIELIDGRGIAPFALERAETGVLKLTGALKQQLGSEVKVRLVPRNGQTHIRARLGFDLPAGAHKATLVSETQKHAIIAQVPAKPRLRAMPGVLDLTGRPGSRIKAQVLIGNTGNVALTVPQSAVAGLFASDGLAGAFSAAYGSNAEQPLDVFGDFINGLRKSHLGLAKLSVTSAENTLLDPGQSREVTVQLSVPKAMRKETQTGAGRRFHATFVMDHLRLGVRLTLGAVAQQGGRS